MPATSEPALTDPTGKAAAEPAPEGQVIQGVMAKGALLGLAALLRVAPATGRAEHGDTPPQQEPWPNSVCRHNIQREGAPFAKR